MYDIPFSNEDHDHLVINNIENYGWHVNKIEEDEMGPAYAYTIGLYETFQHPEILIIGPDLDVSHFIINKIGEAIASGFQFRSGFYYPSLIEKAYLHFSIVDEASYEDYVDHALHYYRGRPFPILQCLYPSPNGSYPGQPEWPSIYNAVQPYLGKEPIKILGYQNQSPQTSIRLPIPLLQ